MKASTEWRRTVVLGDDTNSLSISDMRPAYEERNPTWLEVDLAFVRDGVRHDSSLTFVEASELVPLAEWFERLASTLQAGSGPATADEAKVEFWFEDGVVLTAMSRAQGRRQLRWQWYADHPWPADDLSYGPPTHYVLASAEQMSEMAAELRQYAATLPPPEGESGWQLPVTLGCLGLLLLLMVIGAATSVRWLLAWFT